MTPISEAAVRPDTRRAPGRARLLAYGTTGLLALLALLTISVSTGEMDMPASTALRALAGLGAPGDVLVVQEFRAPRAVAALVAGAGLGVAGCVLQRLFRNPSPPRT